MVSVAFHYAPILKFLLGKPQNDPPESFPFLGKAHLSVVRQSAAVLQGHTFCRGSSAALPQLSLLIWQNFVER